jgi:hypothetical protein
VTRPSLRGSLPVVNTMGIVDVADLVSRGIAQLHNEKQQRRWTPRAEELPICASCASADYPDSYSLWNVSAFIA